MVEPVGADPSDAYEGRGAIGGFTPASVLDGPSGSPAGDVGGPDGLPVEGLPVDPVEGLPVEGLPVEGAAPWAGRRAGWHVSSG